MKKRCTNAHIPNSLSHCCGRIGAKGQLIDAATAAPRHKENNPKAPSHTRDLTPQQRRVLFTALRRADWWKLIPANTGQAVRNVAAWLRGGGAELGTGVHLDEAREVLAVVSVTSLDDLTEADVGFLDAVYRNTLS